MRVRTDAWYFLLKAVWLYQLKCWSGDFSLSEWSRDQQYPRYLCNITPDMCFSLHHLHTQTFPFRSLERHSKVHIGVADPAQAGAKLWCEAILLFYDIEGSVLGNILYDLWWLLSDMLECNTDTQPVRQHQSDGNPPNLVNLSLSQLLRDLGVLSCQFLLGNFMTLV